MPLIELSDIEMAVLHEIIEDYEVAGMRLHELIYFIHFHFSKTDSTIADTYQLALDTLASLESKGAIQFVKQIYQKLDSDRWKVIAEELVPKEFISEILRHPKTWSCNTSYESGEYM
jgi:hypothetical protein